MAGLVRHRQTKEPVTDRPRLNHRATSRLYSFSDATGQRRMTQRLAFRRTHLVIQITDYSCLK
jgi:hypothetical protein